MKHLTYAVSAIAILAGPVAAEGLETYLEFPKDMPPGNLAIGPDGRMFMSVHEFYGPELRVVEVMPDGSTKPYPSETWARAPQDDGDGLRAEVRNAIATAGSYGFEELLEPLRRIEASITSSDEAGTLTAVKELAITLQRVRGPHAIPGTGV